jgi:hypothetical protein
LSTIGCTANTGPTDEVELRQPLITAHYVSTRSYPVALNYEHLNPYSGSGVAVDDSLETEPDGIPDSTIYAGPGVPNPDVPWPPLSTFQVHNWPNQSALYQSMRANLPTYDDICRIRALDLLNVGGLQWDIDGLSMGALVALATNPSSPSWIRDSALNLLGSCSATPQQRDEVAAGLGLSAEHATFLQINHVLAMNEDQSFTSNDLFAMQTVIWALPDPIWDMVHRVAAKDFGAAGGSAGNGVILMNWHDGGLSEAGTIEYPDGMTAPRPRLFEHFFVHEIGHLADEESTASGEHSRWVDLYNAGQGDPEAQLIIAAPNANEDLAFFWTAYFENTPAFIEQARRRSSPIFKRKVAHIVDLIDYQSKTSTPVYEPDASGHMQQVGSFAVERASTGDPADDGDVVSVNGVPL